MAYHCFITSYDENACDDVDATGKRLTSKTSLQGTKFMTANYNYESSITSNFFTPV